MFSLPGLPSISKTTTTYNKNHELNNQGCRCQLCQKVVFTQNLVQHVFLVADRQSEQYNLHHKETYLDLIDELMEWDKRPRKIRYSLPELCVFYHGNPVHLITKSKDTLPIKIIRSKSKLNVFQLQHFFLDGYLSHHPQTINKKRQKHEFKQKMRQFCIIAAKYSKNVTALFTLDQLGNMFKSKFKYMRDDLMYMQTLVGGQHAAEHMLKIDLEDVERTNGEVFARAKMEARIFVGEIKVTDGQFYSEKEEIIYEQKLRAKDRKLYLTYLSLKIIFVSSKLKPDIIKQSVFKWSCVRTNEFLWDVRVIQYDKSSKYWQSSVMQALEIKLQKTMSMIEFGTQNSRKIEKEQLSPKGKEMTRWLEKSTEEEWNQMKVIRNRLEKLEEQKKSLIESQKNGSALHQTAKVFRMRNIKKKDSAQNNSSINPEMFF